MKSLTAPVPVPTVGASRPTAAAALRDPVAASVRTSSPLACRIAS